MNRDDILLRRRALRDEKNGLVKTVMERFDVEMKDKSVDERRKVMLRGTLYTAAERKQLAEINRKMGGLNHMLNQGFFQAKLTPEKKEGNKEMLY